MLVKKETFWRWLLVGLYINAIWFAYRFFTGATVEVASIKWTLNSYKPLPFSVSRYWDIPVGFLLSAMILVVTKARNKIASINLISHLLVLTLWSLLYALPASTLGWLNTLVLGFLLELALGVLHKKLQREAPNGASGKGLRGVLRSYENLELLVTISLGVGLTSGGVLGLCFGTTLVAVGVIGYAFVYYLYTP